MGSPSTLGVSTLGVSTPGVPTSAPPASGPPPSAAGAFSQVLADELQRRLDEEGWQAGNPAPGRPAAESPPPQGEKAEHPLLRAGPDDLGIRFVNRDDGQGAPSGSASATDGATRLAAEGSQDPSDQDPSDQSRMNGAQGDRNPGDTVIMPNNDDDSPPPTAAPAQSGFLSTMHYGACVAGETALGGLMGLAAGGAAGAAGGFVRGMIGGAAVGTFIEPGGGTVALGAGGAVGGAISGGVAGAFYGSAMGVAAGAHQGLEQCGAASSAPSQQNPNVMESRAQPPIKSITPPKGSPPGTKSYQIGKNTITLKPQPGGTYKADFTIKQDFGDVQRSSATKAAGADARANGKPGDVGFHTVAHRFFPGLTETLVPGNGSLNLSNYKVLENRIAGQVNAGNTVTGSVQPLPATAARPQAFSWTGQAIAPDGTITDKIRQVFPNKAP